MVSRKLPECFLSSESKVRSEHTQPSFSQNLWTGQHGIPPGTAAGDLRPGGDLSDGALLGNGGGQAPGGCDEKPLRPSWLGARARAPKARHLGPQLGQEETTVRGQPVGEELLVRRGGVAFQDGPLQSRGYQAHLPHQALSIPRGGLLEKGTHPNAPGARKS